MLADKGQFSYLKQKRLIWHAVAKFFVNLLPPVAVALYCQYQQGNGCCEFGVSERG
jgi:hypothetical protein